MKGESRDTKKRRVCRSGAGIENTPGGADTPGFVLREEAKIVKDVRGFNRLELPRTNKRTVQSSLYLLQGWRANCDVQLILYDSDPTNPDCEELAKVTDYVVAYACKGNDSFKGEKEKFKNYIVGLKDDNVNEGNLNEAKRLARMILNKSMSEKVVSKQECMVQVAGLDLFHCSETIDNQSIAGGYRLGNGSSSKTFLERYAKRTTMFELSLDDYFFWWKSQTKSRRKNSVDVIPHYVGGSCVPIYPPTQAYARSVLLIYKPWRGKFEEEKERDFLIEFNAFVLTASCPLKVRVPFERVKQRVMTKSQFKEPTSQVEVVDYSQFSLEISKDSEDAVAIASTLQAMEGTEGKIHDYDYDTGQDYDWSKRNIVIEKSNEDICNWLEKTAKEEGEGIGTDDNPLGLPTTHDGSNFEFEMCSSDQLDIIAYCLNHVRLWIESFEGQGEGEFEPLRLTVTGVAGSGKSTFINTLVTAIRRLFQSESAVAVCGPTGSAAFSAGGSTCHHLFSLPIVPELGELSAGKLKRIKQKLANVVALIVDERSMLSSAVLAMMEHHSKVGAYRGQKCDQEWGGIPIVILVGDDYQLPSIDSGAIHIFDSGLKKTFATIAGESIFAEFAENVMKLDDSKRQHGDQTRLRDLLKKLRLEESEEDKITKEDAKFLCSFCINNLKNFSESEVQQLQDDTTLFLFANKEPRNRWNREQLFKQHSAENPVAIMKSNITKKGKQISQSDHFEKDRIPEASEICREAKVQLAGANLHPRWGLYNGAMGIVKDIVFDKSHSPNFGDFPLYVLVEFSQYDGMPLTKTMKKVVPIVPQEIRCKYNCCLQRFIPLSLCYAKTIHTFQGQNAGPVQPHQQPNPIQRIICDPGSKEFEGRNPGLFYTTFSRATTLGNLGDKMSSAIYFKGANMTPDRVMNMRVGKNGRLFKRPCLRDQWVRKLTKNIHVSGMSPAEKEEIFHWAKTTVVDEHVYFGLTKST